MRSDEVGREDETLKHLLKTVEIAPSFSGFMPISGTNIRKWAIMMRP